MDALDRVQEIYCRLLELPVSEREAAARRECDSDPEIYREVTSLLEVSAAASEFLETPPRLPSRDEVGSGKRLGRYQLLERIGRGGMGTVWRASRADDAFEKQVALKQIRAELHGGPAEERFHLERQALARLEHPGIARLYDGGSDDQAGPYLVMELVEGTSILDYASDQQLGLAERLRLFIPVLEAVHYAHRNLVVHRDLKPANILVGRDGKPKLVDFGIAKILESPEESLTRTGDRMLTPRYTSPEQLRGEPVSVASDLYSLGVVLFELVTGRSPYHADLKGRDLETAILETPPATPSRVADRSITRRLSSDLDTILLTALRKEPERRYPSAEAFGRDLERFLEGRTVLARPDTLIYRSRKFVRLNRVLVVAAGLVATSLVVALAITLDQNRRVIESRNQVETTNRQLEQSKEKLETSNDRLETELLRSRVSIEFLQQMLETIDPEVARDSDTTLLRGILDRATTEIDTKFADLPLEEIRMRLLIASTLIKLGEYRSAEEQLVEARARVGEVKVVEGAEDRTRDRDEILARLTGLEATVDIQLSRFAVARDRLTALIPDLDRLFGARSRERWTAAHNLAYAYQHLGEADLARTWYERTLAGRRRDLPSGAPETLVTSANFASFLVGQNELPRAAELLEQALEQMDPESPKYLTLLNNVGVLAARSGEIEKAQRAYTRVLERRRQILSPDHPSTLATLNNLAVISMRKRDYPAAVAQFEELWEKRKQTLGPAHAHTLLSASNLATAYSRIGRDNDALRMTREVYEHRRESLGETHPKTLLSLENLGVTYGEQGDWESAQTLFDRAVSGRRVAHGLEHPATLNAEWHRARTLRKRGLRSEALEAIRSIWDRVEATLSEQHLDRAYYHWELGLCLEGSGDPREIERELKRAAMIFAEKLGNDHPTTLESQRSLREFLDSQAQ